MGKYKTNFPEAYHELKDYNELNKKHVGFVVKKNTSASCVGITKGQSPKQPLQVRHIRRNQPYQFNNVKLQDSATTQGGSNPKKVLTYLLSTKICDVAAAQSENQNLNKCESDDKTGGHDN